MSTPHAKRQLATLEDKFVNDEEAHRLLDLIDAEFRTDPMATQCFDRRVVERVALCVAQRKAIVARYPIAGFTRP